MATTNDIYAEMQRYAPLELAESWDNPGLLVDCGREVSRVLVTLDITPEVVEEAAAGWARLTPSRCRSWPARRRLCWAGGATGPGVAPRCRSSLQIPAGP